MVHATLAESGALETIGRFRLRRTLGVGRFAIVLEGDLLRAWRGGAATDARQRAKISAREG